jgi:hypothetical protein
MIRKTEKPLTLALKWKHKQYNRLLQRKTTVADLKSSDLDPESGPTEVNIQKDPRDK